MEQKLTSIPRPKEIMKNINWTPIVSKKFDCSVKEYDYFFHDPGSLKNLEDILDSKKVQYKQLNGGFTEDGWIRTTYAVTKTVCGVTYKGKAILWHKCVHGVSYTYRKLITFTASINHYFDVVGLCIVTPINSSSEYDTTKKKENQSAEGTANCKVKTYYAFNEYKDISVLNIIPNFVYFYISSRIPSETIKIIDEHFRLVEEFD